MRGTGTRLPRRLNVAYFNEVNKYELLSYLFSTEIDGTRHTYPREPLSFFEHCLIVYFACKESEWIPDSLALRQTASNSSLSQQITSMAISEPHKPRSSLDVYHGLWSVVDWILLGSDVLHPIRVSSRLSHHD